MKSILKLALSLVILITTPLAYLLVPFIIIYRQADLYTDQFYELVC